MIKEIDDLKYVGSGYSGHWEKTGAENVPQDVPQGDIKIFLTKQMIRFIL